MLRVLYRSRWNQLVAVGCVSENEPDARNRVTQRQFDDQSHPRVLRVLFLVEKNARSGCVAHFERDSLHPTELDYRMLVRIQTQYMLGLVAYPEVVRGCDSFIHSEIVVGRFEAIMGWPWIFDGLLSWLFLRDTINPDPTSALLLFVKQQPLCLQQGDWKNISIDEQTHIDDHAEQTSGNTKWLYLPFSDAAGVTIGHLKLSGFRSIKPCWKSLETWNDWKNCIWCGPRRWKNSVQNSVPGIRQHFCLYHTATTREFYGSFWYTHRHTFYWVPASDPAKLKRPMNKTKRRFAQKYPQSDETLQKAKNSVSIPSIQRFCTWWYKHIRNLSLETGRHLCDFSFRCRGRSQQHKLGELWDGVFIIEYRKHWWRLDLVLDDGDIYCPKWLSFESWINRELTGK